MPMSKKDYAAIAKILNEELNRKVLKDAYAREHCVERIAYDLCDYLKSDNPKFNESNFMEACLK
jgi:hypothetical protein